MTINNKPLRRVECAKCGGIKENRHWTYCNKCHTNVTTKWILNNREKQRSAVKKYQATHKETIRLNNRVQSLRRCYGITPEEYEVWLLRQKCQCAICKTTIPNGPGKHFMVDHNHDTKKVRGLLCTNCNFLIGHAKDSVVILNKAIQYLERG